MNKILFYFLILLLAIIVIAILILPKKAILINESIKSNIFLQDKPFKNLCLPEVELSKESDKQFCSKKPIFNVERTLEIDLNLMKGFYFENGGIKKIFDVLSKAPNGKWYQTPTGFFAAGVKKEKHLSSLFSVFMPYSIQYNEDFFIHAEPIYVSSGEKVPQNFSGGCIRLKDDDAKFLYENINTGDRIVVYETINNLKLKPEFSAPVDLSRVWIRQNFNNPLRMFWGISKNANDKNKEYYNHSGIDFAGFSFENLEVYSITDGEIVKIQKNDGTDHGFGNTIIIQYELPRIKTNLSQTRADYVAYALYGHLDLINPEIIEGAKIKRGDVIGKIGNTGYGCKNYWYVGEDGCDKTSQKDNHLHFEIKIASILENPTSPKLLTNDIEFNPNENRKMCYNSKNRKFGLCYGYTPGNPENYGYINPIKFLSENININEKEE